MTGKVEMTDKVEMTQEEEQEWIRNQYLAATKFLAEKGLITESVNDKASRYLIPFLSVWKVNLMDKTSVWVIAGDLSTDHAEIGVAETARDSLRHFAMKWQMQAENLLIAGDKEQKEFAQYLISRAEGLYKLFNKDELWIEQSA